MSLDRPPARPAPGAAETPGSDRTVPVRDRPVLFRRFPELEGQIPWVPLATVPTPVEPLGGVAAARIGAEVWVKRDDLTSAAYGGNKVRKLEFVLADALRRGARRLITVGAAGSHHGLATAVYGRRVGLPVTLVLFPQPVTPHVREILLQVHALGADVQYTSRMEMVPAAVLAARLSHRGERPYVVAPGGSDGFGTLGYVDAALEFAAQVEAGLAPAPDVVHVAAGTMGTAAGLALGFALTGLDARIEATRITGRIVANERVLTRLVSGAARRLRRPGVSVPRTRQVLRRVTLRHEYLGAGYGHETPEARQAAVLFAAAGLQLDATYTAKSAAELIDAAVREPGAVHLFWHTLSASLPVDPATIDGADPPDWFRRLLPAG